VDDGDGLGDQHKNAGQAQILHYDGSLFIPNGVNDVFALGGAAALGAIVPFNTKALAEVSLQWSQAPPMDMGRDEALGNYPCHAEAIPYGRAHLAAVHSVVIVDAQLLA
jgi:hypothetical protein